MAQEFWDAVENKPSEPRPTTADVVGASTVPAVSDKRTPTPKKIDTGKLIQDVSKAGEELKTVTPQPTAPDPVQSLYNTILTNWGIPAAGAAYGAYRLGKRAGAKDVSQPRIEPTMARQEPVFNVPVPTPDKSAPVPVSEGEKFYGVQTKDPVWRNILDNSARVAQEKTGAVPTRAPIPPSIATPEGLVASPIAPTAPTATAPRVVPVAPVPPVAAPLPPFSPADIPTDFSKATVTVEPPAAPAPTPATTTKKTVVAGIAPPEGLSPTQRSAFNYIVKSQKELGIKDPAQYVEFVKQVFSGQMPEMGPKGGAPIGFREKMGETKKTEMMPLSKPERDSLRAKGIDIPSSQKGVANIRALTGLAALGGLLAFGQTPEAKAAMQRAAGAVSDLGISPDIFTSKAEEMGRLGSAYVTAGNPQYRAQLAQQLQVETDPVRRDILMGELMKTGTVGGGRGVMPPSAYMR